MGSELRTDLCFLRTILVRIAKGLLQFQSLTVGNPSSPPRIENLLKSVTEVLRNGPLRVVSPYLGQIGNVADVVSFSMPVGVFIVRLFS